MNPTSPVLQAVCGGLGATELILIFLIVLLVFGAGKLPQIGEALGKSIKSFKNATKGAQEDEPVDVTPKAIESKEQPTRTAEAKQADKHRAD